MNEKYHNEKDLTEIAIKCNIQTRFHERFIHKYQKEITELEKENEVEKHLVKETALNFALEYIEKYQDEINKGHNNDWVELYANNVKEPMYAFNDTYLAIKRIDTVQAKEELKIHCRSIGADELFESHFIYLMENGDGIREPEKQARIYTKAFRDQINNGKSRIFADKYADRLASGDWTEITCWAFADAFERARSKGKIDDYAYHYAEKYSDYVGNHYSSINQLETDPDFNIFHDQIIAEMSRWESDKNKTART